MWWVSLPWDLAFPVLPPLRTIYWFAESFDNLHSSFCNISSVLGSRFFRSLCNLCSTFGIHRNGKRTEKFEPFGIVACLPSSQLMTLCPSLWLFMGRGTFVQYVVWETIFLMSYRHWGFCSSTLCLTPSYTCLTYLWHLISYLWCLYWGVLLE